MLKQDDYVRLPCDRDGITIRLGDRVWSPLYSEVNGEVTCILLRLNGTPRVQVHFAGLCDAFLYPMDLKHVEE